jgi:hypothetical protein
MSPGLVSRARQTVSMVAMLSSFSVA